MTVLHQLPIASLAVGTEVARPARNRATLASPKQIKRGRVTQHSQSRKREEGIHTECIRSTASPCNGD